MPLLEVVGAADHRGVEADAGHDREALVLEARRRRAGGARRAARRRPPPRCRAGCRGSWRTGSPSRRGGRRGCASVAGELADAAPDRAVAAPREDQLRALARARAGPRPAPAWPWAPRTRADRRSPPPPRTRRSSGSPPSRRLLGVGDDRDLHDAACRRRGARPRARCARARAPRPRRRGRRRAARARRRCRRARRRRRRADGACRGTCATSPRRPAARARTPTRAKRSARLRDRRGEQQHEARVDRDRRGRVPDG